MASVKLTYFGVRGRGELPRLLLSKAEVEFEDCRVTMEEWADKKADSLYGTLPMLNVGDLAFGQSVPIARFIANKYSLAGKDGIQVVMADTIAVKAAEIYAKYISVPFIQDEEEKAAAEKELEEIHGPAFMKFIDAVLEANGGEWLVGDAMTWADISVYNNLHLSLDKSIVTKHPKVVALCRKVGEDPAIKKWVESRPDSEF